MRDNVCLVSAPTNLRTTQKPGHNKSLDANDLPISKPFLLHKPSQNVQSLSDGINSPHINRKAPSPPVDDAEKARLNDPGSQYPVSGNSIPGFFSSGRVFSPVASNALANELSDHFQQGGLWNGMRSTSGPSHSTCARSSGSSGGSAISGGFTIVEDKCLPDPALRPPTRRLSAPAPLLDIIPPQALRAASSSSAGADPEAPRTPTTTGDGLIHIPKLITPNPSSRTFKPLPKLRNEGPSYTPTCSQKPAKPTPPKLDTSLRSLRIGPKPQTALNVQKQSTENLPKLSPKMNSFGQTKLEAPEFMRKELAYLNAHAESLKARNKQLRTRLEEALRMNDQTNIELSVSAASRNALRQQVVGYEKLYESTIKNLENSQKLVKVLKYTVQELKMNLQEKELEIYNLTSKQKHKMQSADSADLSPILISPESLRGRPLSPHTENHS